jgi:hypothetical protein
MGSAANVTWLAFTNISRVARDGTDNKHEIRNKIEIVFLNLTLLPSYHNELLNVKVQ